MFWTEDILAEVLYRLRRKNPAWSGRQIATVRAKIVEAAGGGQVTNYSLDGDSPWSDPYDHHVHAAAIACAAGYLITNDKGFQDPNVDLDALSYEVYRPDEFLTLVDDNAPGSVLRTTEWQMQYYVERYGEADLCGPLRAAECPDFAERVRAHLQTLA